MKNFGFPLSQLDNSMTRHTETQKNKIVSLIARKHVVAEEDIWKELDLRGGWDSLKKNPAFKELKNERVIAKSFVVDPKKVRVGFQRFWIFIQTRYDENHRPPNNENYQDWICRKLAKVVADEYSDTMRVAEHEVLLGGGWDIVLVLDAKNERIAHQFVIQNVRTCEHVTQSSTAWSVTF